MRSRTSTVLSTLRGVREFMTTNASALGTLNHSDSRRDLDEIEAELSDHAVAQAGSRASRPSAAIRKRLAKDALVTKFLRPISAIAEAKLQQSPDFAGLRVPRNTGTTPRLLAAAAAIADAAAKHADVFIAAGMAPTFVADLQAAADEVQAAETAKCDTLTSQIGATKGLDTATRQARKIVRQLDALIEPLVAYDTSLLVKWKATKRFSGRVPEVATVE